MYISITTFFQCLSLIKPVILRIEDLQWIDNESINLLEYLINNFNNFPIYVINTCRLSDKGDKYSYKLKECVNKYELILSSLPDDAVKELIKEYLDYLPDKKLFDFILSKSKGNPFFIEQICLYLREFNFIEFSGKEYSLRDSANVGIPDTLSKLIIARLDRLSIEIRNTADMASVIGIEFDRLILEETVSTLKTLIDILKTGTGEFFDDSLFSTLNKEILDKSLHKGIELLIWEMLEEMQYTFKHGLLRDAIYNSLSKKRLKTIHRVVAETFERLFKNSYKYYMTIAYHYEKGEIIEKSCEYYEKAGD